jgi:hypothetical protein
MTWHISLSFFFFLILKIEKEEKEREIHVQEANVQLCAWHELPKPRDSSWQFFYTSQQLSLG